MIYRSSRSQHNIMDLKSHSHRTGETGNSPVYPVDSVVSMNYVIFYKENDIPKVTLVDSLQDTENLMRELKSQKVKCYYIEFDYEQLVHFSSVVQLVDRSEYDYTRDLFDKL